MVTDFHSNEDERAIHDGAVQEWQRRRTTTMIDRLTQRAYKAACTSLMASLHRDSAPDWDETLQSTRDAYRAVVAAVVDGIAQEADLRYPFGAILGDSTSTVENPGDWLRSLLTETRP